MRPDYCPVGNEPCQSLCGTPCTILPKREWLGLTEDEAIELLPVGNWEIESTLKFAKAVEAKLRKKNT